MITGIISAVSGAFGFLTTVVLPAFGAIQTFSGGIAALVTVLGGPITVLAAVAGAIAAFVLTNEDARKAILDAWNAVVDFFKGIPDWFNGVVEDWKAGVEIIHGWMDEKAKGISQAWEDMKQRTSKAWQATGESVKQWASGISSSVSDWTRRMGEGIRSGWNGIVKFIQGIPNAIVGVFRNAGSWLVNAGKNIINGFLNGLKSAWGGVTNFVGGIGNWISNHKGPEAYDKALLVPNGKWIMEGLERGLHRAFEAEVEPYVESMAGRMQDAFGNPVLAAGVAPSVYRADGSGSGQRTDNRNLTVVLELDRMQFGRAVYQLNSEETQRVGLQLAGGVV
jgi:phage-related protein